MILYSQLFSFLVVCSFVVVVVVVFLLLYLSY